MPGVDPEVVRHALSVARQRGYAEVEIESEGATFKACLEKARPVARANPQPSAEPANSNGAMTIKAPLVGYYRAAKSPLEAGKTVSKGEVVAVIAALGLANEVESPHAGEIEEVLVQDGDPVEYGQTIARLKVSA